MMVIKGAYSFLFLLFFFLLFCVSHTRAGKTEKRYLSEFADLLFYFKPVTAGYSSKNHYLCAPCGTLCCSSYEGEFFALYFEIHS